MTRGWSIVVVVVALAGAAQAQSTPEIDADAVERIILACRETPMEADLAARLETYGIARAPSELDATLGLEVSTRIQPSENPRRAAAAIARLLAERGGDPALRAAIAYYALKDMAFYRDLNCEAVDAWYHHVAVFTDLRAGAASGDSNRAYYTQSEAKARRSLAQALRARRRITEKEAALVAVLGLGGE
ncbi:MAG: hypothetical protein ACE5H8_00655 [Alphaproteobacteria bacterium]